MIGNFTVYRLDCLRADNGKYTRLLIMININRTENGSFLERFGRIADRPKVWEVYVLSTFSEAQDLIRAKLHPQVKGFFHKPIARLAIECILRSKLE